MKYFIPILVGIVLVFSACDDDEPLSVVDRFNKELEDIDNYLAENGITDTLIHNPSNIRYTINAEGDGLTPLLSDSIYVDYEGSLLYTGEVFDSGQNVGLILDQTIAGWEIMLQEMEEGDDYTIYVPSYYAYGSNGSSAIPPNSPLIFDIKLIRVAN
jgi:FKBP-type peptidyl-prolyl cis-trans isomerase